MVDAFQLASDVLQTSVFLATPPLLWLFLFLFVWEDPARARAAGFTRRTFWLLVPGAVLAQLLDLPIFTWNGAVLAVNLGGGLIPMLLSVLLVSQALGDRARLLTLFLAAFAAETAAWLAEIFLGLTGSLHIVLLLAVAALPPALIAILGRRGDDGLRRTSRRAAGLLAITGAVSVGTFAVTSSVPGLGIVSAFPGYLAPPLLAGAIAVLVARRWFEAPGVVGLPVAFASVTLGVLVGADVLRQPPLYGGAAVIYAIGGAGTGDLLYLSGLLSLVAAYVTLRFVSPSRPVPSAPPAAPDLRPVAWLRRSLVAHGTGRAADAVAAADQAVEAALSQTRRLLAMPPPARPELSLEGLPVPRWVVADRQNLSVLATSGPREPADPVRAWLTARWLVRIASELGRRRFAPWTVRSAAFLIDLAVVTAPAIVVWYYVALTAPAGVATALRSVPFNVVALAYPALALLYFAVAEAWAGQTVGKRLLGLRVGNRSLGPPGPVSALLRNVPKSVTLFLLGIVGPLAAVILVQGGGSLVSAGGIALPTAATLFGLLFGAGAAVAIPGAVGAGLVWWTPERQRFGDLMAGTWVVRDRT